MTFSEDAKGIKISDIQASLPGNADIAGNIFLYHFEYGAAEWYCFGEQFIG